MKRAELIEDPKGTYWLKLYPSFGGDSVSPLKLPVAADQHLCAEIIVDNLNAEPAPAEPPSVEKLALLLAARAKKPNASLEEIKQEVTEMRRAAEVYLEVIGAAK